MAQFRHVLLPHQAASGDAGGAHGHAPQHPTNMAPEEQRRVRRAELVRELEERVRARILRLAGMHDAYARLTAR